MTSHTLWEHTPAGQKINDGDLQCRAERVSDLRKIDPGSLPLGEQFICIMLANISQNLEMPCL